MTKNPFPGMNPYLEERWPDVHSSLITYIREALGIELPVDLSARAEEEIAVVDQDQNYRPDVSVTEDSWRQGLPPVWSPDNEAAGSGAVAVSDPMLVRVPNIKRRWIEIHDDNGKLITIIEILSPTNKEGNRPRYIFKRNDMCAARINVVEIDLLRDGEHTVDVPPSKVFDASKSRRPPYLVCVNRAVMNERREVYPCQLSERLPVIRIPLRKTDADVPLDLQAMVNRCYETGRYWKLDYKRDPVPPFTEEERTWADGILRNAGLR